MRINRKQAQGLTKQHKAKRMAKMDIENVYKAIRAAAQSGEVEAETELRYANKQYIDQVIDDLKDSGFDVAALRKVTKDGATAKIYVNWKEE